MALVKAYYQHRVSGTELVNHEQNISGHGELCAIIDNYPWATEIKLTERLGEGGGFYFMASAQHGQSISYQFVPMDLHSGLLDLDVVVKPGFLRLFGRQSLSRHFGQVSITEAKQHMTQLFSHSAAFLYKKYYKSQHR